MLHPLDGQIIQLQGSLLGFKELDHFKIHLIEENSLFAVMQSTEDQNISFIVTSPFSFHKEYEFALEQSTIDELELGSHEDALIITIMTLQEPFKNSTINLLAPIVINVTNGRARQIVLPPHYDFKTKTPLSQPKQKEEV